MNKVLIIGHNASSNQRIKSRLENEGYSVETTESGDAGLQKAREGKYKIILVDFTLPDASGPDVCYILKHGSKSSKSKILFLAPENEEVSSPSQMEACSDGFICTEDSLEGIIASIKGHLSQRKDSLSA